MTARQLGSHGSSYTYLQVNMMTKWTKSIVAGLVIIAAFIFVSVLHVSDVVRIEQLDYTYPWLPKQLSVVTKSNYSLKTISVDGKPRFLYNISQYPHLDDDLDNMRLVSNTSVYMYV